MSYESNCGCQEIQPEIVSAIAPSMPTVEPIQQNIISVFAESIRSVDSSPTNSQNDDELTFAIQFSVSVYDTTQDKSSVLQTAKYITLSKTAILQDAQAQFVSAPKIKIESKEAKRFRELAGVPHNKNFV